ncbi:uncharacterized protein APUU_70980S [Aspergillus puulaauensis]|uniref:Uncharacterized protein n=1 Tax=Aspergillus puulaauensis TaxID=1220207 RepID=A0A7R8AU17_9EURO|nr:uncharacterized protein APUU_70980S [Aspergillus puulaauensis]BCS29410.1 hypothetical protein APUU_70980S [Aspergillus puulaauensis]
MEVSKWISPDKLRTFCYFVARLTPTTLFLYKMASRSINTPDELEHLIRCYLRTQTANDITINCPESLLYVEPIKKLMQEHPRGNHPWFSYDREHCLLKLFAMARPLHDAAAMLASSFMTSAAVSQFIPAQIQRKIAISTKGFLMTRSYEPQSGSKVQAWTKYPDLSIVFRADQPIPVVVFETGFSEAYDDLKNDATQWLQRSGGKVRLVILVKIEEDLKTRRSLQKDPASRKRIRQLVREFGTDIVKEKHGLDEPENDESDASNPDIYDNIRASVVVYDWVGPITANMELWELHDGVPMIREQRTVLPRPESPTNPVIKITDLVPLAYREQFQHFDETAVHEIDLEHYRDLLQDALQEHAFHRAVTLLRAKPTSIDSKYNAPQNA